MSDDEYQELSPEEIVEIVNKRLKPYRGNIHEFEKAVGALMIGQKMGWKPLMLIHDKRTIKKYGDYLDLEFKNVMPPIGEYAKKSLAWHAMQKLENFWKAVKGEIKGIKTPEVKSIR